MLNQLHLRLQFFSTPDGQGGGVADGEGEGQGENLDSKDEKNKDEKNKGTKDDKKKDDDKTFTQEEVNSMIDARFKRAEDDKQKAIDEAKKLAEMNAEQKREYEFEQLQKENEKLKSIQGKYTLGKEASKMLKENNIIADDELLELVVGPDADETSKRVKSFVSVIENTVKSQVEERLKGTPPKRTNSGNPTITKESIMSMKDSSERIKAIQDNPGLF